MLADHEKITDTHQKNIPKKQDQVLIMGCGLRNKQEKTGLIKRQLFSELKMLSDKFGWIGST